jgi:hypothetical protein
VKRGRWAINESFIQTPWFGIYVHFIYREDLDPVPHDHPWNFIRMVLRGSYIENYTVDPANGPAYPQMILPFRPLFFPVNHAHRIVMVKPGTISLVLVGRKIRDWGFWGPSEVAPPRTWVDYRDALGLRPAEGVTASQQPITMRHEEVYMEVHPTPASFVPRDEFARNFEGTG